MNIPGFPRFRKIDISCKDDINRFLAAYPLEASEYTFTNLFAFGHAYDFRVSVLYNNLIILKNADPATAFCPVGDERIPEVVEALFEYLEKRSGVTMIERVPRSFVDRWLPSLEEVECREERDHFDYLYRVQDLINLRGRKYHDKKNKVNRFREKYDYQYISLTPELVDECLEFQDFWCEMKECEKTVSLEKERCAILQMLCNFGALDITGGAIRVNGRISAVTIGERVLDDTVVIHMEKANPNIPGLYQVINQEFLMHEVKDCTYVNREQDLGIDGLRNAKLSYHPVDFVRKYRIRKISHEQ